MTTPELELGLDTFGYITVDESGQPLPPDAVIRNYVEEAVLADSVGIDSFNIGEHYRPDFMDSAAHVVLAATPRRHTHHRAGPRGGGERRGTTRRRSRLADRVLPVVRVRPRRL